jgi:hypothetical protein
MADYNLNTDLIAQLIVRLLPHKPPLRLALDRTNWKFGKSNINILTLAIVYQGVAFPILYTMMPKFGNSTRKNESLCSIALSETIDSLLADLEFVGEHWLAYLNEQGIYVHKYVKQNMDEW